MPLPDLIEIVPLDKPVRAEITVPGSKSITNRALILAALAEGEVTLEAALWSEDTQIMVDCLQELGFMVDVRPDPNEDCNRTITVYGKGGVVPPGGTEQQPMELFVGNAGTAARFLAALVCLGKGVYRLHGVPRMHERPQAALFNALSELGYRVESEQGNDRLPARIFGEGGSERGSASRSTSDNGGATVDMERGLSGEAAAGHRPALPLRRSCTVSIEQSSQFASALLLCAKAGGWNVNVVGENAEESPYVAMTLKLIEAFPHRGGKFQIEPDASSGSYFWAVDWILWVEGLNAEMDQIRIKHWPETDWQIDTDYPKRRNFLEGCHVLSRKSDLGDSIMTAIVKAPFNRPPQSSQFVFPEIRTDKTTGSSDPIRFTDLGRLRVQETERVFALKNELGKCGVKVEERGDELIVFPGIQSPNEPIETYNDHRMAMCFAILGLKVPGIKLKNPACVKKTFPNFFQKLAAQPPKGLGATILDAKTGRALAHDELFAG
jgi:3-phosphoshikimate 1-carboxyvinyltransferase